MPADVPFRPTATETGPPGEPDRHVDGENSRGGIERQKTGEIPQQCNARCGISGTVAQHRDPAAGATVYARNERAGRALRHAPTVR